jgi:hypothetical protein
VAPSLPTATRNRARTSKRSIPPREPSGSREVTRGAMFSVMQLNSRIRLRGELALGRQELNAKFASSPPRILRSGELLAAAVGSRESTAFEPDGHANFVIYPMAAGQSLPYICRAISSGWMRPS